MANGESPFDNAFRGINKRQIGFLGDILRHVHAYSHGSFNEHSIINRVREVAGTVSNITRQNPDIYSPRSMNEVALNFINMIGNQYADSLDKVAPIYTAGRLTEGDYSYLLAHEGFSQGLLKQNARQVSEEAVARAMADINNVDESLKSGVPSSKPKSPAKIASKKRQERVQSSDEEEDEGQSGYSPTEYRVDQNDNGLVVLNPSQSLFGLEALQGVKGIRRNEIGQFKAGGPTYDLFKKLIEDPLYSDRIGNVLKAAIKENYLRLVTSRTGTGLASIEGGGMVPMPDGIAFGIKNIERQRTNSNHSVPSGYYLRKLITGREGVQSLSPTKPMVFFPNYPSSNPRIRAFAVGPAAPRDFSKLSDSQIAKLREVVKNGFTEKVSAWLKEVTDNFNSAMNENEQGGN